MVGDQVLATRDKNASTTLINEKDLLADVLHS
jgi:hypothetical protein